MDLTSRRWLLGGELAPVGWNVAFLDRPIDVVTRALLDWRAGLGQTIEAGDARPYPYCLRELDPVASPWAVELLIEHGDWTVYLNNSRDGGDMSNSHLRTLLDCRWITAMYSPRLDPGHAITAFWLLSPDGEPPLMYERTITANATDGRWTFETSGTVQPFEQVEAYTRRLKRERFTREMLLDYLAAYGIHPDDASRFGRSTLVRQHAPWVGTAYTNSIAGERAYLGLPPMDPDVEAAIWGGTP